MQNSLVKIAGIVSILFLLLCVNSFAQNTSPVNISFDENSKRIDLVTGKELPDYKYAKRGSVRFFLDRLDTPDDYFNFFHDGIRQAKIESLNLMEKVQQKFNIWRIRYKNGGKNTPRIHHKAVSFIPLSTATKEPERRVYVMLNDLKLIEWGNTK